MAPLDDLVTKWPLKPFLYVDDLAPQVQGSRQQVARYACSSTKHLVLKLEGTQHLSVSRGVGEKFVYITTHLALAREVASDMGELGIYPVTTTKLLGIDRRTNARQARRTRTKRLGILRHGLAKLKVYKRAGATVTMVA